MRQTILKVVYGVSAIVVALCIVVTILVNSQGFQSYAAGFISKQITAQLGDRIELKSVYLTSITSAAVDNVTIYDKQHQLIARVKQIEFWVNPLDLLTGNYLGSLSKIKLIAPEGWMVQNSDDQWNYEDLLNKQESGSKSTFAGTVEITQGHLQIKSAKIAKTFIIQNINFTGDFANMDKIKINGSFNTEGALAEVSGTVGSKAYTNLQLRGREINLRNYSQLLPADLKAKIAIKSGDIDSFDVTLQFNDKGEIDLQGPIRLSNLAATFQGYQLSKGEALVIFNHQDIQLFTKVLVQEQAVTVQGKIKNYLTEPDLDLFVRAQEANLVALMPDNKISGKVDVAVNVRGKLTDIKAIGTLKAKQLVAADYHLENVMTSIRYGQHILWVDDIKADFNHGWVWAAGKVNLDTLQYSGIFKLNHVELNGLVASEPGLQGSAIGTGSFSGSGTDWQALTIQAELAINKLIYHGITATATKVIASKQGDSWQLSGAEIQLANGGSIAAGGSLKHNILKGKLIATNINLSMAKQFVPSLDISGNGNVNATLSGDLQNPQIQANFIAQNGNLMGERFDAVDISVHGTKNQLVLERARLLRNGEVIQEATGTIGLDEGSPLALTVTTRNARAENLLKAIMPNLPLTGNVDNVLLVKGTLQAPQVSGKLHFYEGSYDGWLINQADGDYQYADGNFQLKDIKITTPYGGAIVNGKVIQDNLAIDIHAKRIDLSRIPVDSNMTMSGLVDFDGQITGTIHAPKFEGSIGAPMIIINDQILDNLTGDISYYQGFVAFNRMGFDQGKGRYSLHGNANLNSRQIHAWADVKQASSRVALAMANVKNEILMGDFNGSAEIMGAMDNPHIIINGDMPTGSLKGYPLKNIQLQLEMADKVVDIKRFYGEQGAGKLAAIGKLSLAGGPIDARISANSIDPNLVAKLLNVNMDIKGELNGDVKLSGTLDKPKADVSIYVQSDGSQFNNAYVLGNLKDNILYINQAVINKEKSAIKAYGTIPLAALGIHQASQNDAGKEMDLQVHLDNTDLSLLPTFTSYVEWATGQLKGDVEIKGTLANPYFNGNITTADSAIKFKDVANPLEKLNINIVLHDQKITVEQFNGVMGKGDFSLTGSTGLNFRGLTNYNFALNLNGLQIVSPYYKGKLQGNIAVNEIEYNGMKIPKLTTDFNFNDVTVAMPPLPQTSDAPLPLMALDINVNVGNNVHAFNPMLYDLYLRGGFTINGTTRLPQAAGSINVTNGTINVLKTIFKVKVGTITFNQLDSYFPTLDFLATTKIDRTQIFASLTGPVDKDLTSKLYSEPQMTEAEIIKLLAFRSAYQDNGGHITQDDLLGIATIGLQMSFLNEVEGSLRNMLHLDEFRIMRDTLSDSARARYGVDDNEVYNIEIGKYLSNNLMLRYTKGINYDLNRIGIQYDFSKHAGILTEMEGSGAYNVKLEMQWKF